MDILIKITLCVAIVGLCLAVHRLALTNKSLREDLMTSQKANFNLGIDYALLKIREDEFVKMEVSTSRCIVELQEMLDGKQEEINRHTETIEMLMLEITKEPVNG